VAVKGLPPLGVCLLVLGACPEAIQWAGRRPVSVTTLRACPRADWRAWLVKRLRVRFDAPWSAWVAALRRSLGYGDGNGYGDGYGYGLEG